MSGRPVQQTGQQPEPVVVRATRFGAPDVLRVNDVELPAPGAGEVLVAVGASSVNGHDTIVRAGGLKVVSGRKFPIGVGLDFAGVVAAIGPDVRDHRVGDRVWGTVHPRQRHLTAGAAEHVVVPADRVAAAPADLSAVDAASLVVAGTTALIGLRDVVRVASGDRVLVRGAAGGVGTAAVQLAHALGGEVTALARERHAPLQRELGADEVVDHSGTTPGPDRAVRRRLRHRRHGAEPLPRQARPGWPHGHGRPVRLRDRGDRGVDRARRTPDPRVQRQPRRRRAGRPGRFRRRGPVVAGVHPLADVVLAHQAFERGGVAGKHVIAVTG